MEDLDETDERRMGEGDKSEEEKVDEQAIEVENAAVADNEVIEGDKSEKEVNDKTGSGGGELVDSESDDEWEDADEENNKNEALNQRKRKREDERPGRLKGVDYQRLGEKLADILEQRERARKRQSEEETKLKENWLTGDIMLVCRCCSLYSQSPEVPPALRVGLRGRFGAIIRKNRKGRKRR